MIRFQTVNLIIYIYIPNIRQPCKQPTFSLRVIIKFVVTTLAQAQIFKVQLPLISCNQTWTYGNCILEVFTGTIIYVKWKAFGLITRRSESRIYLGSIQASPTLFLSSFAITLSNLGLKPRSHLLMDRSEACSLCVLFFTRIILFTLSSSIQVLK